MMNKRHTRTQMVTLLRQAMDQDHVDSDPSLDDEHLILLATGRLGELSDDEQIRVLNRVSADDQTAQLLKQLRDLDLEPAPVAITLSIMNSPLRRGVTGAWVAAACVLVCFGLWRFADPPMGSNANSGTLDTTRLTIMSLSDQPPAQVDYWAQLDEQLLTKRMEHDRLRDHALLAICIACLILTVPLAWWTFRNGLRQKPSPQQ